MKAVLALILLLFCLACISSSFDRTHISTLPDRTPTPSTYDFLNPLKTPTPESTMPPGMEAKKTFCTDPQVLPVWNLIRRQKVWREGLDYTTEDPNCVGMFEIKRVDLNRDSKSELLVRGKTSQFCGAVGNCQLWVFAKVGNGYRLLLNTTDYWERSGEVGKQVRKNRTHGYRDIRVTGHFSVSDTSFTDYKFDGRKYVESRCRYETRDFSRGYDPPRWHLVPCAKFFRDRGLG